MRLSTEPTVRVTTYTVSLLPDTDPTTGEELDWFQVRIEARPGDRWVVMRGGRRYLDIDGQWTIIPADGHDDDAWVKRTYHDLETATSLAKTAVRDIRYGGKTAVEWLAELQAKLDTQTGT